MSFFDRAERLLSRRLGRVFHEIVLITPMRSGRVTVSRDRSREPFEIMATLDVSSSPRRPMGEGNTAGDVAVIMGADISLAIELRHLAGREIREGDHVTAIMREGRPTYVIAQEAPLGISERKWELLPETESEDDP